MSRTEEMLSEVASGDAPPEGHLPRLAAMVFTDVVGYSARMQADPKETIAAVQADFDRMRALAAEHGGEVLNTMGDGMMLSFGSAEAGMRFALAMQTEFGERYAAPGGRKSLQHRVGIHIGDVYRVEGGHMAGDGVNIAARLEPHAPHGGIAISQLVYDFCRGKVQMRPQLIGPRALKNIAEPMMVWRVVPEVTQRAVVRPITQEPEEAAPSAFVSRVAWFTFLIVLFYIFWPYKDRLMQMDFTGVFRDLWHKFQSMT
jgi:class 3 adenylate cyclase